MPPMACAGWSSCGAGRSAGPDLPGPPLSNHGRSGPAARRQRRARRDRRSGPEPRKDRPRQPRPRRSAARQPGRPRVRGRLLAGPAEIGRALWSETLHWPIAYHAGTPWQVSVRPDESDAPRLAEGDKPLRRFQPTLAPDRTEPAHRRAGRQRTMPLRRRSAGRPDHPSSSASMRTRGWSLGGVAGEHLMVLGGVEMADQLAVLPQVQAVAGRLGDDHRPVVGPLRVDRPEVERRSRRRRRADDQGGAGPAGDDRPVDVAGDHRDDVGPSLDHRAQAGDPLGVRIPGEPADAGGDRRMVERDQGRAVGRLVEPRAQPCRADLA